MPDNDIKNIVKLFSEISNLIVNLENKHRLASNLLINLILENQKRISQLEQQISGAKGKPVSEISISTGKTNTTSPPEASKVDLTDVLSELGLDEKQPVPASVSPGPIERKTSKVSDIISSKESTATSILSSGPSEESEIDAVGKTPTISRYGSVAVLKKQSGSSKFRPRTPPPPKPKPKPMAEGPPSKKQNKKALAILDSLKTQISEETTTHELCKTLETIRDELANIVGFSSVIRDIGVVSNKLKHAPDLALDSSSIEAFIKKVDAWKSKI